MATRAARQRAVDEQDERRVKVGLLSPEYPMPSFGVELIAPLRWVRGAGYLLVVLGALGVFLGGVELAGLPILQLGELALPVLVLGAIVAFVSLPLAVIIRRPWYPVVLYVALGFLSLPLVTLVLTAPLILLVSRREVQVWFSWRDELSRVFA